ncbi:uncharacterized protein LOC124921137 [Impatiens glandulifera]|uniref:uncharacterized protein LOC124921137 n=1 Tax=Impatiens glandulifera TaxID=253017 RepID=UPI001FB0D64E|nr:uncharacterized protein LOC124921137 [Impatiens glandulifera]
MELDDWESDNSDSVVDVNEEDEGEECYLASFSKPKVQFRKHLSKARWINEMGMSEILEIKGQLWRTIGVVRDSKIYCSIEETLYLAEEGALHLLTDDDDGDKVVQLRDLHNKLASGKHGCCFESYEVYKHLRSLGYIVGRHGVLWSTKSQLLGSSSMKIDELFEKLQINNDGIRPVFDVYSPNSKFRKTSPGNPCFILCLTSDKPPSRREIGDIEKQCDGIPVKFCHVEHGRISFFSYEKVDIPSLP